MARKVSTTAGGLQFNCDWHTTGTKEHCEKQIGHGFRINGPGLYTDNGQDCVVVICPDRDKKGFWKQQTDEDEIFQVFVYNCEFQNTVLSIIGTIPSRS